MLTPDDVDSALKGQPHVVLAVEGASFVDADPSQIKRAYDLGVRHLQLVHYIKNPLSDFQTEKPEHDGLHRSRQRGRAGVQSPRHPGRSSRTARPTP